MDGTHYEVIVIGAGPAGLTAGIYLGRARVRTLIIDSGTPGGQMLLSYDVANYPGVAATSGREIAQVMRSQAEEFGCTIASHAEIEDLDLSASPKVVTLEDGDRYTADAIILAVGGVPRTLGLDSEARLRGLGISYCATCDGDFFTGKEIVAIGGGNSALEEAIALTRYAERVTVIHEFDEFQAQPWLVDEARANPKIAFMTDQEVRGFIGQDSLEGVLVADKKTGQEVTVPAEGAFVFIGYVPNTGPFSGQLSLNERGEIATDDELRTDLPGVFAAGDSRAKRYRQITTSVADGTIAALSATEYLRSRH